MDSVKACWVVAFAIKGVDAEDQVKGSNGRKTWDRILNGAKTWRAALSSLRDREARVAPLSCARAAIRANLPAWSGNGVDTNCLVLPSRTG